MRTQEEQIALLEHLLEIARKRREAGETEWLEFKTNISESHSSITYEGVGRYISGISNVACLKEKAYGYLVLGVKDGTWEVVGTNLRMAETKIGNQDYELWLRKNLSPIIPIRTTSRSSLSSTMDETMMTFRPTREVFSGMLIR